MTRYETVDWGLGFRSVVFFREREGGRKQREIKKYRKQKKEKEERWGGIGDGGSKNKLRKNFPRGGNDGGCREKGWGRKRGWRRETRERERWRWMEGRKGRVLGYLFVGTMNDELEADFHRGSGARWRGRTGRGGGRGRRAKKEEEEERNFAWLCRRPSILPFFLPFWRFPPLFSNRRFFRSIASLFFHLSPPLLSVLLLSSI